MLQVPLFPLKGNKSILQKPAALLGDGSYALKLHFIQLFVSIDSKQMCLQQQTQQQIKYHLQSQQVLKTFPVYMNSFPTQGDAQCQDIDLR